MESALSIGTCSALGPHGSLLSLRPGAALVVLIIICCVIFYTVEVSANAAPKDDEPPRAVIAVELDVAVAATKAKGGKETQPAAIVCALYALAISPFSEMALQTPICERTRRAKLSWPEIP